MTDSPGDTDGKEEDGLDVKFFTVVGRKIRDHPLMVIAIFIFMLFVAYQGAGMITTVTGKQAFAYDSPDLKHYDENLDRSVIAVVVRGDANDPDTVRAIKRFDDRMSAENHVLTVKSLSDEVLKEYGRIPDQTVKIKPFVGNDGYSIIEVVMKAGLSQKQKRPVYSEAVRSKEWVEFPTGTQVTITGSPVFSTEISDKITKSTTKLLAVAAALIVVALLFLFRGVPLRLLPMLSVVVGLFYAFGSLGYLGIPNSTLTSAAFPILIGLGIDYAVQFHSRYTNELKTSTPKEALPKAVGAKGPAVFLAMSASALGFVATAISNPFVPALVWFTKTAVIGVFLSFLTAMALLTSILYIYTSWRPGWGPGDETQDNDHTEESLDEVDEGDADVVDEGVEDGSKKKLKDSTDKGKEDDKGVKKESIDLSDFSSYERFIAGLARKLAEHPAAIFLLAGILMMTGFHLADEVGEMKDTKDFVPQDISALVNLRNFHELSGGGASNRYSILVQGSGLSEPSTLRWMEEFEDVALAIPEVKRVESPADAIKRYNDGKLPQSEIEVEAAIEKIPREVKGKYFSQDFVQMEIETSKTLKTDEKISLEKSLEKAISFSEPPPGISAGVTDRSLITASNLNQALLNEGKTTFYGLLFVFLLLLVYKRDFFHSLAPVIPMMFVTGWQGGLMFLLGIPDSPLTASLGAMAVGIGAEYTIIITERFEQEKKKYASRLDAIEVATARVGNAITVSGVATVAGFSALIISPFPILAGFGKLTVGVITMALIASLVTLPPILYFLDGVSESIHSGDSK
ncbi:MAG: hydrophobe/amphiphile efflux-3 (HAE3) family transporter [Halobacteria archaeon]